MEPFSDCLAKMCKRPNWLKMAMHSLICLAKMCKCTKFQNVPSIESVKVAQYEAKMHVATFIH